MSRPRPDKPDKPGGGENVIRIVAILNQAEFPREIFEIPFDTESTV